MTTRDGIGDVGSGARVESLLLGTTLCGGVIAAGAGHTPSIASLVAGIIGTVLVYWAAHLHAATLAIAIRPGSRGRSAFGTAVLQTWRIPAAATIPVAVLTAAALAGADVRTAAWLAIAVTAALLGAYGYLAGQRAGLGWTGRAASTLGGVAVGLSVVVLKASLH